MAEEEKEDKEAPLIVVEEADRAAHEAQGREDKSQRDDDDDGDEGDERLGAGRGETEEDVAARGNETEEQRRERNRKNKRDRRARQNAARERDQRERDFLLTRLERVERENNDLRKGQATTQIMTVDGRIQQVRDQLAEANRLMGEAVEANAGADVVKITEIRDELQGRLRQLEGYKEHLKNGGAVSGANKETREQPDAQRRNAPPPDPEIATHSRKFQDRLGWFDPRGNDPDSAVVYAIDVALGREGRLNPRTAKYWTELEKRVKAALPHRFETDDDDLDDDDQSDDDPQERPRNGSKKGGGPRIPTGDRGAKNGKTFYISKERKEALQQAGIWDDPKLRQKYVQKYMEWDEANAPRR